MMILSRHLPCSDEFHTDLPAIGGANINPHGVAVVGSGTPFRDSHYPVLNADTSARPDESSKCRVHGYTHVSENPQCGEGR